MERRHQSAVSPRSRLRRGDETPHEATANSRSGIIVALRPRPKYTPGSGPPLQLPTLLPSGQSTAYIVDRILLPSPGRAGDGKPLPKRMAYIVGWRDLPAARLLVSAMKVLEYVPPRVLEEWEAEMEQSAEQERAALLDERRKTQEMKARPKEKEKEKKKTRVPAHNYIEPATTATIETEQEAQSRERLKRGAMSLSTPQKRKLKDFDSLSSEEVTPSRQLRDETTYAELGRHRHTTDSAEPVFLGSANVQRQHHTKELELGGTSDDSVSVIDLTRYPSVAPTWPHVAKESSETSAETSASGTRGKTRKINREREETNSRSGSEQQNEEEENEVGFGWEVLRLEDMKVYEVEGQGLVRYFQVRWKGDWPADQNPTWEPEQNVTPDLVRNYFKMSKKRRKQHTRSSKQPSVGAKTKKIKPRKLAQRSKHSDNVIVIEDDADLQNSNSRITYSDDDELLIFDEGPATQRKQLIIPPDYGTL